MKEVYREPFSEVDAIFELMPVNLLIKYQKSLDKLLKVKNLFLIN